MKLMIGQKPFRFFALFMRVDIRKSMGMFDFSAPPFMIFPISTYIRWLGLGQHLG
jgi:hypothetical protein